MREMFTTEPGRSLIENGGLLARIVPALQKEVRGAVSIVPLAVLAALTLVTCTTSPPTLTVTPTPTYTPTPTATPEPKPAPTATHEPSGVAPLDPDDSAELLSRLSQDEHECITDFDLLADFWSEHPDVEYEDVAQQMGCLRDKTLLHLYLAGLAWRFENLGGVFREDTASCIRDGLNGISLGGLVREAHTAESDLVRQAHSAVWDLTVFYCLSEEEVALAAPYSGITDEEYDRMMCAVEAFGELEGLTDAYKTTDSEEFTEEFLTNLYGCDR